MNKPLIIAVGFLLMTILFHGVMLINLTAHFQWESWVPPRWHPVKTNAGTPEHWKKGSGISWLWRDTKAEWFDEQLQAEKKSNLRAKRLLKLPDRQTDNFGLDFWIRDATRTDPGGDFFQLYQSGWDARHGFSIYETDDSRMRSHTFPNVYDNIPFHPPNRYPPGFVYTIGILLSMTTPWQAYLAWVIIHESVLLFCILLSMRCAAGDRIRMMIATGMWLGFFPWYLELYMGQTTFLIMAATFMLGLHLKQEFSGIASGFWFALSLITKPLTLLYTPLLLREKKFGILLSGIGVAIASSLPYFINRPEDGKLFIHWASGQEMISSLGNYCFQNLMYHFHFSGLWIKIIMAFWIGTGLIVTCYSKKLHPIHILSLWVCIYFMTYTHVWQHHLVLLLPAVILPYLISGRIVYLIPWCLATLPSLFYWFEGNWNWIRDVLYLSGGVAPIIVLMAVILMDRQSVKRV